ncbi:hypothetical protein [Heyndrickxia ginsengihumi]|uniref:Uncharacterized protein n=2 Tax=Heyndrickxia ginsengihumi TaxID=363870 RepID=A0A6M0PBT6_9BACI|nr:hypothetical protein [Heyndrickxia ginsengihumi]MBE6184523.1 hypothetical protein [Bacillus sp. (in: firmicutes)]MCM3023554.1 hypothetical protein [Heyndrickxia ginsengihumi]NEY21450.1 hypothetical protein [Heyndrickxia ginsengihumi]
MSLENRVLELEKETALLKQEIKNLKKLLNLNVPADDSEWIANRAGEWMIKVVYPGIYDPDKSPSVGFPHNRRKIAEQIKVGQMMFIYVTRPVKKIIGLTRVVSSVKPSDGKWPYVVDLEWIIVPKPGLTLAEAGLNIRPRIGESLYAIKKSAADRILQQLNEQPDLDMEEIMERLNQYIKTSQKEKVTYKEAVERLKNAGFYEAAEALANYRAHDGSVRGWDEFAERGELYRNYPKARSVIWPNTYFIADPLL